METAEGFGEGKRWMEGGRRPGVARQGGPVCASPSAEPWEQRLWGCQRAGQGGRSGWADPGSQGPPEAVPPSERLPPVPAGAAVAEGSHQPYCLGARQRKPGARGEPLGGGRCAGQAPGKLARDGAPCHLWALGASRACSPFLGGPRQRVARRGPYSPARKGAGPGSVAQRGGKGTRSRSVAWAGCQQVPHPLQTHREGAQGSVGPQAPELSPAGGGPGSRQSPGPGALMVAPGKSSTGVSVHRCATRVCRPCRPLPAGPPPPPGRRGQAGKVRLRGRAGHPGGGAGRAAGMGRPGPRGRQATSPGRSGAAWSLVASCVPCSGKRPQKTLLMLT